jgi:arginine exporter protein ArgO
MSTNSLRDILVMVAALSGVALLVAGAEVGLPIIGAAGVAVATGAALAKLVQGRAVLHQGTRPKNRR